MKTNQQTGQWLPIDRLGGTTYYDYERQAWIVNGRVDKCGHRQFERGCYACSHAGEEMPRHE